MYNPPPPPTHIPPPPPPGFPQRSVRQYRRPHPIYDPPAIPPRSGSAAGAWGANKTMKIIHDYHPGGCAPGKPFHGLFGDICNNCGKLGHTFKQCKNAITSFGVIVFRKTPEGQRQYLMIRRKDTLGYIDFMRGKYTIPDTPPDVLLSPDAAPIKYVLNMFKQMTIDERARLLTSTFDELWANLWGPAEEDAAAAAAQTSENYQETFRQEEIQSREKFMFLNMQRVQSREPPPPGLDYLTVLQYLVVESRNDHTNTWHEPEWGFPKGRRNYHERDYECALREMCEETGYPIEAVVNIKNILPFEEYFIGSNYKSYKHKYYLMYMDYQDSLRSRPTDKTEVSSMCWKTYQECIESIRPYNAEKRRLITNIESALSRFVAAG